MSDRVSMDNKLKAMMEEPPSKEKNIEELLALRIGNASTCLETSQGSGNSSPKLCQLRPFPCRYCDLTFSTARARGGHQKAHRREKAERDRKHEMSSSPLGVGNYANRKLHLPNTSFTAPPKFEMNGFLGGGVARNLNRVVDLQETNQAPSFVESRTDNVFPGSRSLGGLEGNASAQSKHSISEELDLSLTL